MKYFHKINLFVGILVIILVAFLVPSPAMANKSPRCTEGQNRTNAEILPPISSWLIFQDKDHEISIAYPNTWKVDETINQELPYADTSAIIKRYTFSGSEGVIDFDIWLANNMELNQWLEWYSKTRYQVPLQESTKNNDGTPYLIFVQNGEIVDMLTGFFTDGEYIYRIWYTVSSSDVGIEIYEKMINSIVIKTNEKPQEFSMSEQTRKDIEEAVASSAIIIPMESSCCGRYSASNPFPCCSNQGNCTWWVYYSYGSVPFRGNASTWYSQVPDYPTWNRGSQPSQWRSNIAWWNQYSAPPYGHVAYVPNYTGGTTIYLTEMYWCSSCYHTRTISYTNPNGYMWTTYVK